MKAGTILRTDLDLYESSNNGEVVCGEHTYPSDIHVWRRLSIDEASEWAVLKNEIGADYDMGDRDPCEWCETGQSFPKSDRAWRP